MKKQIITSSAPAAIGPYSQAVASQNFVFCSGQIGINPGMNDLVGGGIAKETERALKNLEAILRAKKLSLKDVVKTEVFLKNMADFGEMNLVYEKFFSHFPRPARSTVGVADLPKHALVEISCIASIDN
jgi:2-iminobutanoate/2-iminopropanoate deaminase